MNGHLDQWIDAYLDDELPVLHRQQAEAHLAHCADCRSLLAQRKALSSLLQEAPPVRELKPDDRFVAEVGLQLGVQKEPGLLRRPIGLLVWLSIPVVLFLGAAFIQTVFILSGLVGLIPDIEQALSGIAFILPGSWQMPEIWVSLINFFVLPVPIDLNWLTGMIALLGIGLLSLCWLASWWVYNRQSEASPV